MAAAAAALELGCEWEWGESGRRRKTQMHLSLSFSFAATTFGWEGGDEKRGAPREKITANFQGREKKARNKRQKARKSWVEDVGLSYLHFTAGELFECALERK